MKHCEDCGTIYIGDECPECGSVRFTEAKTKEQPPIPEKKEKKKNDGGRPLWQNTLIVAFILIATVIIFAFLEKTVLNIFEPSLEEKAELITLDMKKDEVLALLGEPDEVDEKNGYYFFYADSFKKKYQKYQEKLDKASTDIQKQFELSEKMKGKKTQLLRVRITGADPEVTDVVFDSEHLFNDIVLSKVSFNIDQNYESIEIIDGVVAISDEVSGAFKFQKPNAMGRYDYILRYSSGSFIKSSCYENKHFYLEGRPEGDTVEFDFTYNFNPHVLGSSSSAFNFDDVKIPISVVSLSADGNLSVGDGIRIFRDVYTEGFEDRITSITLPKSIRTIADDAFVSLPRLTTVNLASESKYIYEEDGVIYNLVETVVADTEEPIIDDLKIVYINNGRLPELLKIKKGVTRLGPQFDNKTSLVELTIPTSVEKVDTYFVGCSSLNKINVPKRSEKFVTDNGILYFKEHHFSSSSDKTLFIPRDISGDVSLKYKAALGQFEGRSQITSIEGELVLLGTLKGCSSLKKLTLVASSKLTLGQYFGTEAYQGGVPTVQGGVTYYVPESLTEIMISGTTVSSGKFENCSNIKSVTFLYAYSNTPGASTYASVESGAFVGCSSLTSLTVSSVKSIMFAEKINSESKIEVESLTEALELLKSNAYPDLVLFICFTNR